MKSRTYYFYVYREPGTEIIQAHYALKPENIPEDGIGCVAFPTLALINKCKERFNRDPQLCDLFIRLAYLNPEMSYHHLNQSVGYLNIKDSRPLGARAGQSSATTYLGITT